jgi:serine/threonine protein kinase
VWKQGMAGWVGVTEAPELSPALTPPPPPPSTKRLDNFDTARTIRPDAAPSLFRREQDDLNLGKTRMADAPSDPQVPQSTPPPSSRPSAQQEVIQGVDFPVGYVLDDTFVITLKLGQGGMGAVYRVTDRETQVEYAIKVLASALAGNPQALRDLKKEVAVAQPLVHQNLLNIKYFADSGPVKYVVMENIDGEDLETYRRRKGGRISQENFARIAPQILAGLDYLHERGVVHLDIKPQNIMVSKSGEVKITDYGISKTIKEQLAQQDQSQAAAGTLCYMAPEQIRGEVCDRRTDVYAVGIMFHLLLAGRFPFPTESREQVARWHIDEKHSMNDLGTPAFNAVVRKCLRTVPSERFLSCHDLLKELTEANQTVTETEISGSHTHPGDSTAENISFLISAIRRTIRTPPAEIAKLNIVPVTYGKVIRNEQGAYAFPDTTPSLLRGVAAIYKLDGLLEKQPLVDPVLELVSLLERRQMMGLTIHTLVKDQLQQLISLAQPVADKTLSIKDKFMTGVKGGARKKFCEKVVELLQDFAR